MTDLSEKTDAELKDGGPAFPRPASYEASERISGHSIPINKTAPSSEGMSLRDYLIAHAMQGMLSSIYLKRVDDSVIDSNYFYGLAENACDMADAILAARAAKGKA